MSDIKSTGSQNLLNIVKGLKSKRGKKKPSLPKITEIPRDIPKDSGDTLVSSINDKNNYATYSFISSWNNNYNSWKFTKNINKILIKYEDLENDIEKSFTRIIEFTNKIMRKENKIDIKKLKRSIETTSFDLLKKKEEKEGFDEAIYSSEDGKNKSFFNLGKNNDYKKLLKKKTVQSIEDIFKKEMKELGYL